MNSVVLIGRLTRDPQVRYIADSQTAVANFAIAIDRPVKAGAEKKADFPQITVFGKQAENCEKYLSKGRLVAIQGSIQTGSYTNKEGQKVYTTGVIANRVQFLDWGDKQGQNESRPPQQAMYQGEPVPDGFAAITDDDIPF